MASLRLWAVVPAAGRGLRLAESDAAQGLSEPKQYRPILGRSILQWALEPLLGEPRIAAVVVAIAPSDRDRWLRVESQLHRSGAAGGAGRLVAIEGGASRSVSVLNALDHLAGRAAVADWVLVHDAARPCLDRQDLSRLLDALADDAPGAVLGAPIADTVKRESAAHAVETVDRRDLWRALTPQAFRLGELRSALQAAHATGFEVTDEAAAMQRRGCRPLLIAGSPLNIKVTGPDDFRAAESLLRARVAQRFRVGQGFDVHAFEAGDHLMLGGVRIAHDRGLRAHSDGDVIIHAICDALLGAIGAGDIGEHFPDDDPRLRGADSREFLRDVSARVRAAGYRLENLDVTVLAETPRIAPHRAAMRQVLAADLGVDPVRINIKATTTERLGFIGRREGIAASAIASLSGLGR